MRAESGINMERFKFQNSKENSNTTDSDRIPRDIFSENFQNIKDDNS